MNAQQLPHQHLSVRVPWHDTGWTGSICTDPLNNSSCLRLGRIAEGRDDVAEIRLAGRPWTDLAHDQLPPCASERAGFMSSTARTVEKEHPYASWNDMYRRFRRTTFQLPAHSADCVPYRWMLRDNAVDLAERFQLPYRVELEEQIDELAALKSPVWVQHAENQQILLDTFFSAARPQRSLVFFYAKETPLSDDPRRTVIGVGRVTGVGNVVPYVQDGAGFGSVLWERVVNHSIRPNLDDGFLLPYHELLDGAADGGWDPATLAVMVPDELVTQFSYATEHVTHDGALAVLLELDRALNRIAPLVSGTWDQPRSWLNDRIDEVWQARGPCPGLGAALTAFGLPQGVLLAYAAQAQLADNDDPWPLIDRWLRDPDRDPESRDRVGATMSKAWAAISDERRDLLRLVSRFDLTIDQATRVYQETERAKAGIELRDADIIANPYVIYEADRLRPGPASVSIIDRGVFPADQVRAAHPLPAPSRVDDAVDARRVRALVIDTLEQAASSGDTLRARAQVIQDIRDRALQPACPVSNDVMEVCSDLLPPEVAAAAMANGDPAYQLQRLDAARRLIARQVNRRAAGAPLEVDEDWRKVIDTALGDADVADDEEELARQEKAAALEVLATSRISVLVGPAGTGKTTLLRMLAGLDGVAEGGVLLLAPTGKARVRMQEAIGREAFTLAQLLVAMGRYDPETGRYRRSDHNRSNRARTIIVDECSMLTEDALDALLDGLEGFERLILVGDPRQLPPIGAGRPFVDIINHLRSTAGTLGFPRTAPGYAELTVTRRQTALGDGEERLDLALAEWFGGEELSPAADEVWDRLGRGETLATISTREWSTSAELHDALREEVAAALPEMAGVDDSAGFQQSYGGTLSSGHVYFNVDAAPRVEAWQVLSPVRAEAPGVNELNRMIQRHYRAETLEMARNPGRMRRVPRPAGPQEIIYGDKVINVRNATRRRYFPSTDECLEYVANGEIGVVTGPFRTRNGRKPPMGLLNVAFSTQPSTAYTFWMNELGGDDGTSDLELAYAITIHKSQGSEFGTTFVVIPAHCRLLSRELLYTALTRHRNRDVVLHEGDLAQLREYSGAAHSETAARLTNLFTAPEPVQVNGRFLEAGLIHRTRKGVAVRSKSEVIIADLLFAKGIEFQYEQPLVASDGTWRSPDFTIIDDTTGTTIFWEHLGLLHRESYRRRWDAKVQWYRAQGVLPHEEGGGPGGVLVTTRDGADGSISSGDIEQLVDELLG